PLALLLVGALQDIAVLGVMAAAALSLSHFRWLAMPSRVLFGVFSVLLTVLHIIRSEAVVFFGEVVRVEDLRGDIPIVVALRSLTGVTSVLLLTAAATLIAAFLLARRLDEHFVWLTIPRILAVFAIAGITAP